MSDETYHSFVDSGIFKKLQASKRWILPYKLKERIKNEGIQLGKEEGLKEGEKKKAVEMEKVMKIDGEPIDKIVKYTQLSITDIEKL